MFSNLDFNNPDKPGEVTISKGALDTEMSELDPEKLKHMKKRDSQIDKIEELDNRRETITKLTKIPEGTKNVPFELVPQNSVTKLEEVKRMDSDGSYSSKSFPKDDRDSIDVFRASQMSNSDVTPSESKQNFASKVSKDELFEQWYRQKPRENNTITEDVDAENAEESNRISTSTINSISTNREGDVQQYDYDEEQKARFENEPEEENELHQIHMLQSLQALQYMKGIEIPPIEELADKMVVLPKFKHPGITKTLIFDMDETLIHCVDDIEEEKPQQVLTVRFEDGEEVEAGINVRPYAIDCLKAANEMFQVIVFTASHKCYADVVLDYLDPTGELIQYRLYRDS